MCRYLIKYILINASTGKKLPLSQWLWAAAMAGKGWQQQSTIISMTRLVTLLRHRITSDLIPASLRLHWQNDISGKQDSRVSAKWFAVLTQQLNLKNVCTGIVQWSSGRWPTLYWQLRQMDSACSFLPYCFSKYKQLPTRFHPCNNERVAQWSLHWCVRWQSMLFTSDTRNPKQTFYSEFCHGKRLLPGG